MTFEETVTVTGTNVRIYTRDTGSHGKIHGAYEGPDGNWHSTSWNGSGFFHAYNADTKVQHLCAQDLNNACAVPLLPE